MTLTSIPVLPSFRYCMDSHSVHVCRPSGKPCRDRPACPRLVLDTGLQPARHCPDTGQHRAWPAPETATGAGLPDICRMRMDLIG
jgi:hypothetical protein